MSMFVAHARTHFQHHRIDQGVRSGELTREETQQLRGQQREIRSEIRDARSDGQVTKDERQQIRELQNEASRDIYQAKHDCDRRSETPRVDRRQERQQQRIDNGIDNGSLTKGEATQLGWGQQAVESAEAQAKSDGVVSFAERQQLQQLQNQLSRAIFTAKHNAACRP
jgi:uncharacterized membrane protein YebE (DUF533 family)